MQCTSLLASPSRVYNFGAFIDLESPSLIHIEQEYLSLNKKAGKGKLLGNPKANEASLGVSQQLGVLRMPTPPRRLDLAA